MFKNSLPIIISVSLMTASLPAGKTTRMMRPGLQVKDAFTRTAGELSGYNVPPATSINFVSRKHKR